MSGMTDHRLLRFNSSFFWQWFLIFLRRSWHHLRCLFKFLHQKTILFRRRLEVLLLQYQRLQDGEEHGILTWVINVEHVVRYRQQHY